LEGVKKDFDVYALNKLNAIQNPDKYISVAFDGFDTRKTQIPHRRVNTKATEKMDTMAVPFTGALIHGHLPGAIIHYTHGELPKDSSYTTQCVLQTLKRVFDLRPCTSIEIIYIQMDNCHRENKNRTLLWLMAIVLRMGYSKEVSLNTHYICNLILFFAAQIHVNFCLKGHTHNDVDQMFSVFF
jgi:hypothetical protein